MQRKLRAVSFVGALVLAPLLASGAWLASPSTARAQDGAATAQARARFAEGLRFYDRADWAHALDSFRAAYAARPHPSVLVNIANCFVQLGRPTQAVVHFTRYLAEIGEGVEAAQRAEIEQALADARATAGTLAITATPEGAMVFVDGDRVGRAPIAQPIDVDPGPHVVELRTEDGASTTARVTVGRGEHASVRIGGAEAATPDIAVTVLPATSAAATPATAARTPSPSPWRPPGSEARTPPPARPPIAEPSPPAFEEPTPEPPDARTDERSFLERVPVASWIVGGIGVVALGVGTGFGVAALSSQSDFDDAAARIESGDYEGEAELETLQARGRRASDAQSRNAVLSDVALGLGVVGVATAVTLFVIDSGPDRGESAAARSRRRARARVGAMPLPGGGMIGLSGSL